MRVTINMVSNGAVVEYDDGENVERVAYRYAMNDPLDAQEMFCDISDWIGLAGSRHDKTRLYHVIRHGDKYECSGCDICTEVL